MRTIIAGSRHCSDIKYLLKALEECGWTPTTVISGAAPGADLLGEMWAMDHKVPIEKFPANWAKYGKSAGMVRNREMARNAHALIALWDGVSRGTSNMIRLATERNLKVHVQLIPQGPLDKKPRRPVKGILRVTRETTREEARFEPSSSSDSYDESER